jgi:hypothetical protein
VAKDQTSEATADIDAPIVFVGYGIHAPEYHWDDYAGPGGKEIDMKGKIALVIVNEPPSDDEKFFKGKALTYYGRWTYKYEEAAGRGAVGVLIVHRTDLASYGWAITGQQGMLLCVIVRSNAASDYDGSGVRAWRLSTGQIALWLKSFPAKSVGRRC